MRSRRVVTALVVTAVGLTASAALRRLRTRRAPVVPARPTLDVPAPVVADSGRDAVILRFARPATETVVERPAAVVRCGDTGGLTKAGAPCGARANRGGRCHHHPLAA